MEELYPEGIINTISINLFLNDDGSYEVICPQWKFEGYSKNPIKLIKELVNEIINHNNECLK